ncbi:MAG: beta-carotene 3-hydroxylase [Sphingobacteriales bacterium]|jgi:beta-carotene 3-hydroxylase
MQIALYILTILLTIILMECVAWANHKFIMHGFLWNIHKDHHEKHNKTLENNDFFSFIYAIPSIFLIVNGTTGGSKYGMMIGIGVAIYGLIYTLVHEGFIHQRLRIFSKKTYNIYFNALRKGHWAHHAKGTSKQYNHKHDVSFGMLLVPFKYFKEAIKESKKVKNN